MCVQNAIQRSKRERSATKRSKMRGKMELQQTGGNGSNPNVATVCVCGNPNGQNPKCKEEDPATEETCAYNVNGKRKRACNKTVTYVQTQRVNQTIQNARGETAQRERRERERATRPNGNVKR